MFLYMKSFKKVFISLLVVMICVVGFSMPVFAVEAETGEMQTDDGRVSVTIHLTDINDDKVNVVQFRLKNQDTKEYMDVTFLREDDFTTTCDLPAGTYDITFRNGDNNRELELEAESISVKEGMDTAGVDIKVTKVINNEFFPKFFRNNSFMLILLAVAVVAYFIIKKKKEQEVMDPNNEK